MLLRRSASDALRPGAWDFPGGGIEPGEGIADGLSREVREETGLSVAAAKLTLVYAATAVREQADESITRLLFVAHLSADAPIILSFEHDSFKWADIATTLADFPHPFYAVGLKYADEHGLLAA